MSQTMIYMLIALAGELVLLVLILLLVSFFRNRAQRRRDTRAARELVARIKKDKDERDRTITQWLSDAVGLSGEALDKAKVAMLRAELGFLQRLASVYRMREADAFAQIDGDLFAAIEPYHALGVDADGDVVADAEPVDTAELEHLRSENKRLSDELTITMETMSRMLNEYSTMFAGGEADTVAPIAGSSDADVAEIATQAAIEEPPADGNAADDDLLIASDGPETLEDAPQDDVEMVDGTGESVAAQEQVADEAMLQDEIASPDPSVEAVTVEEAVDELADDVDDPFADLDLDAVDEASASVEAAADQEPDAQPAEMLADLDDLLVEQAEADSGAGEVDAVDIAVEVGDQSPEDPAEEHDPIAEILREAQSQEASARGGDAGPVVDETGGDTDSLVEVGPSEVVAMEDDEIDDIDIDDIDDLFDAVDTEADEAKRNSQAGS